MRRARAAGIALGVLADAVFGDPTRGHPVAAFGRVAARTERAVWRDSRGVGAAYFGGCVLPIVLGGSVLERITARRPAWTVVLTAGAVWTSLGGTSLGREGTRMARLLSHDDLPAARARLQHLCARDPEGLGRDALARATVESLAENTSDAVVAPLFWAMLGGIPGVLGYRAVNTLDAMVGYHSARYERFGWAAARLDDLANLAPARITGALAVLAAPVVGGSSTAALRTLRRDRRSHPSPNGGHCESAFAGALGVRLGGTNRYHGDTELRPSMGDGPAPGVADIGASVRLSQVVSYAAAVAAVVGAALLGRDRTRR